MAEEHKKSKNWIWIGIAVVVVIVLVIVFINNSSSSKKISQSDITLSNIIYESNPSGSLPIYYDPETGLLQTQFSFTITLDINDLNYKVYDAKSGSEIAGYIDGGKINLGDNKFIGYGNIISSLGESPQLKVCVSKTYKYNTEVELTGDIVCKIQTFNPPEFKIEITPNPLTFEVSKSAGTFDTSPKTITIKNTGNIVAPSIFFISNYLADDSAYQTPKYYPQYPSKTTTSYDYSWLKPGESYQEEISVMIGNVGEFDTPTGTYETKGYVYGISGGTPDCKGCSSVSNALFKKEFTIRTIVNS